MWGSNTFVWITCLFVFLLKHLYNVEYQKNLFIWMLFDNIFHKLTEVERYSNIPASSRGHSRLPRYKFKVLFKGGGATLFKLLFCNKYTAHFRSLTCVFVFNDIVHHIVSWKCQNDIQKSMPTHLNHWDMSIFLKAKTITAYKFTFILFLCVVFLPVTMRDRWWLASLLENKHAVNEMDKTQAICNLCKTFQWWSLIGSLN